MNSVQSLLLRPFKIRTSEEKSEVKRLGRPTPNIEITQIVKTKNRIYNRKFNPNIYEKYEWLCGCEVNKALYCFPCLLFGGDYAWVKHGIADIQHLLDFAKKHECSTTHIRNELNFAFYGNSNVGAQMYAEHRKNVQIHNEKVTQNRYILNIIINRMKFCGTLELVLKGHKESDSSQNGDIFRSLIKFSAELGSVLRGHLENATVLKGPSKSFQNEILECMLEVSQEEISKEIKEAEYLAIIADETSDTASVFEMVIIYRYLVNGKPVERFWSFIRPTRLDPQSLSVSIISEIECHVQECWQKLIAQTYDGTYVMSGSKRAVQAKIKEKYPHASYIHYHAHKLDLIMLNTASINRNVRIFFANLQGLSTFFADSPQRTAILGEVAKKRSRYPLPSLWDSQSRTVKTIFNYRAELIECMKVIMSTQEINNTNTLIQASGFLEILKNENFVFWLSFFHQIMIHMNILVTQLQKHNCNPSTVQKKLKEFERRIQLVKNSMDDEENLQKQVAVKRETELQSEEELQEQAAKKRKTESMKRREAAEVCDMILGEMNDRFSFTGHLVAATLFNSEKFSVYHEIFPKESLKAAIKSYPFINETKMRAELSVMYSRVEFRNMSGALCLMDFITENKLNVTFSECVKLLKVVLTIPMSTAETERCLPTLKSVRTFLKNTVLQDRSSALGMLSIEREFIMKIRDFNERVIDKFARNKERWADFVYK